MLLEKLAPYHQERTWMFLQELARSLKHVLLQQLAT